MRRRDFRQALGEMTHPLAEVVGLERRIEARETTAADPYQGVDRDTLESLVTWDKLSAHRRVLLLDSCHSGEKYLAGSRAAERGARVLANADIERMTKSAGTGLYIMAASAEDWLAREADGNGLFTRAVLEGLRGEADRNHNGEVEISELTAFVGSRVHELNVSPAQRDTSARSSRSTSTRRSTRSMPLTFCH